MFQNNLAYEIKLLLRSNWLVVLFISIFLLVAFAISNGKNSQTKRLDDIVKMEEKLQQKDSVMLATLEKIEQGKKLDMPYWQLPSEPMTVGYRNPRLAIMQPEKLSFIAIGQSDMYTHFKSPTVYGNNFALDYAEMVNPVQLLFGNFDLAFVIIYILPLLIIAFSFNVLSKEKELGTLRLIGAQPISVLKWLLQKMCIRFIVFSIITLFSLKLLILIFSPSAFNDLGLLLSFFLIVVGYILFWFIVSVIVNLLVNDSSKNAFSLIAVWLLIVLIIPATINQIGNTLYPTPSRLKMINEIRLIKKENEEKQNEIMDDYLKTHPELVQENEKEKFGFWHNYFASEKAMEAKIKPLLAKYDLQINKQQKLIAFFEYISPAILLQQSLNNIAGTSSEHYNDFKKQVFEFSNDWRNYLVPMLFKGEKFKKSNYDEMPNFIYKNRIENKVWRNLLVILIVSTIVLCFSVRKSSKSNFLD
jgi:ABC-2 type transport system permease protein